MASWFKKFMDREVTTWMGVLFKNVPPLYLIVTIVFRILDYKNGGSRYELVADLFEVIIINMVSYAIYSNYSTDSSRTIKTILGFLTSGKSTFFIWSYFERQKLDGEEYADVKFSMMVLRYLVTSVLSNLMLNFSSKKISTNMDLSINTIFLVFFHGIQNTPIFLMSSVRFEKTPQEVFSIVLICSISMTGLIWRWVKKFPPKNNKSLLIAIVTSGLDFISRCPLTMINNDLALMIVTIILSFSVSLTNLVCLYMLQRRENPQDQEDPPTPFPLESINSRNNTGAINNDGNDDETLMEIHDIGAPLQHQEDPQTQEDPPNSDLIESINSRNSICATNLGENADENRTHGLGAPASTTAPTAALMADQEGGSID